MEWCNKFCIVFIIDICYNVGVMRYKIVTRGKPFQSKLAPYEAEMKELKASGASIRVIAAEMTSRHGLTVSHNAVASFLKTQTYGCVA